MVTNAPPEQFSILFIENKGIVETSVIFYGASKVS